MKKTIIFFGIVLVLILMLILESNNIFIQKKEINYENYHVNADVLSDLDETIKKQQENDPKNIDIDKYTVDSPYVLINPYYNSPLTALILFSTKSERRVQLEINGIKYEFEKSQNHVIPVIGLISEKNNIVSVKVGNKKRIINIKVVEDENSIYKNISIEKNLLNKKENSIYTLIFLHANPGLYGINKDGEVTLYIPTKYNSAFKLVELKNGNILLKNGDDIVEMDYLGKIYKKYGTDGYVSHSSVEMDNGNILVIQYKSESVSQTPMKKESYIVELERKTGKIIKEINVFELLSKIDKNLLDSVLSKTPTIYCNSIEYNNGIIYASLRDMNAIISIDYKTENLNWILGGDDYFSDKFSEYKLKTVGNLFYGQHAISINKENELVLLNNNIYRTTSNTEEKLSTGQIWKINGKNATLVSEFTDGKTFSDVYSSYIQTSTGYIVDFGHVNISMNENDSYYGTRLYELDEKGKIIWNAVLEFPSFTCNKLNPYKKKNENYF